MPEPFRISPSLGPDLWQAETQFYWDTIGDPTNAGDASYQPGSRVTGNDGADYIFVKAHANIAADAAVGVDTDTWETEAGTGYSAPVAVTAGQWFHVRVD
ncbi:hypothetical protein [Paracoccus pantotrophus]|uniref:hypothetical protein n=1 Tax=Paracoccus pantotrophus TaxID=82367 RepID=UPI00048C4BB1|nr:hypothetical protein [Paracoccus pantotrophus]